MSEGYEATAFQKTMAWVYYQVFPFFPYVYVTVITGAVLAALHFMLPSSISSVWMSEMAWYVKIFLSLGMLVVTLFALFVADRISWIIGGPLIFPLYRQGHDAVWGVTVWWEITLVLAYFAVWWVPGYWKILPTLLACFCAYVCLRTTWDLVKFLHTVPDDRKAVPAA